MEQRNEFPPSSPASDTGDARSRLPHSEGTLARRRALLKAAASAAPFATGLVPNAALAATSASLAAKDACIKDAPGLPVSGSEEVWMRRSIPYGYWVNNGGNRGNNPFVYEVSPGVFYQDTGGTTSAGTQWLPGSSDRRFVAIESREVLILYDEQTYAERGVWPQYDAQGALQGLHASAYGSLGRAPGNYICPV